MYKMRPNDDGFAHSVVILAVVVVIAIGLVFTLVLKRQNSNSQSNQATNTSTKAQTTANNDTVASTASPKSPATTTTPASSASTSKTSTSTSKTTSPSSSSTPTAQTPAQTPLSALTTLITNLKSGSQVNITASAVSVAGPITTAQARPIVFSVNGQTYFAYRQGQAADFTLSPSATASTMAIVSASGNPSLVQAHLDKLANLVDPSLSKTLVGYSQGGN